MRHIIILVFLIHLLYSCSSGQSKFGNTTSDIVVSGKIQNFNNHQDHKTIQAICSDLFDRDVSYTSIIDENGLFKIKFSSTYPQEFYLKYGTLISIFCFPGDSLHIEIDGDILKDVHNKYPNGTYFCKFPDNELGKTNFEINKYKAELPSEEYSYKNANEAEKNKSPVEYKEFIQQREKKYSDFLETFNAKTKTTHLFKQWASDHLKYESLNDLMRYRWTHPRYNQMDINTFVLPTDYFSFLDSYNMNDCKIFTLSHIDFLHELSMHLNRESRDSLIKASKAFKESRFADGSEIIKNIFKNNSAGFTHDLLLAKFYIGILKGQQLTLFEAIYDSSFTKEPFFLSTINSEYENLKKYFSNQNTEGANLISLKSSLTSDLVDEITSKYKNKVIFIDFWAPWCSPCMSEMSSSKEIQEIFNSKEVIFLFLACQSSEDSWKATIANKKISGEHILLSNDQFAILSSLLGINGIPHYSLIDKKGIIVMKNAPRPSEKGKLINEISKLL